MGCINYDRNISFSELERDINNGMSIMGIWPHPDDEIYTPGIFIIAGSKGNKCWVVTLISIDSIPKNAQEPRQIANAWFEDTYLEEYINLGMTRVPGGWHGYNWSNETIKARYKAEIEEKRPDILLTFTPYGFWNATEHGVTSDMITDIWDELNYEPKPKIYWFINTNQGPRWEICNEHELYPPTDVLDLDVYSEELATTYWEAKVDFWENYVPSMDALGNWMTYGCGNPPCDNTILIENNDRKEYFVRYK